MLGGAQNIDLLVSILVSAKLNKKCNLPETSRTVWPSGLRRQTQVLVERSAWVRTPQLSFFMLPTPFVFEVFCGLVACLQRFYYNLEKCKPCQAAAANTFCSSQANKGITQIPMLAIRLADGFSWCARPLADLPECKVS